MTEIELLCKDCDMLVAFVPPLCEDGQDDGDLMCVICGTAVTTRWRDLSSAAAA